MSWNGLRSRPSCANAYSGTRAEFCALVLGTRGLATKSALAGAVEWLRETNADLTHIRRTTVDHEERP